MVAPARERQRVVFLDDDEDLREIVVEVLASAGATCEAVATVDELRDTVVRSLDLVLVILDVNLGLGGPTGIDAYRWLRASGYRGAIAFLTGHARTHPLVQRAAALGDAVVLEKPITHQDLLDLLPEPSEARA
jgi:FixJ family two-component response regulator